MVSLKINEEINLLLFFLTLSLVAIIFFEDDNIGVEGAKVISGALQHNNTLTELHLYGKYKLIILVPHTFSFCIIFF